MSWNKSTDASLAIALNQTLQWRRRLKDSVNTYGEPDYAGAEDIACRVSRKFKLVRNGQGEEVTSEATVTTLAAVNEGDEIIIDGRACTVIAVSVPVTLSGVEHRRKAYV